jgi:glutamate transport system substrate-binding protein
MTRTPRLLAAGLSAGLLLAGLTGCGSDSKVADTPPPAEETFGDGTLTIGIDTDQPGIGFKDGDTYSGFDVETAKYVAAKLGVPADKITWVEAQPADREELLTSGKVDLVFSTYSITAERKKQVDFAGPYFEAHQDLLVTRNNDEITGPTTLNGKTLCSVTGTTSAQLVKSRYKGRISLVEKPEFSDCVEALANGDEVNAVTTDDVILAGFAASKKYKGKLKVVGDGFSDELYGVGVKKGDTELVDKVNAALEDYIKDGSWKKNLDATVGPSGYSLPDPPTPGTS